ncbi:ATP-binding protein [Solirubrobacter phytolaccae]|uniref:ATP-binding protein n=1 Tax=Solirubrobacter phytolaccae TaxID=1404360 RepID=A0A9X3NG64_9ACTN|nr:ATP-binding protein [Solirubrobacter phytolaccae]MDA0184320.1 ATP-binding protein [Solirubrobacter phytolaccae]
MTSQDRQWTSGEALADLQVLIETPRETLDVELKEWLDLTTDNVGKATLAKEILALANHGGGWLIVGASERSDGWVPSGQCPYDIGGYSADAINAIVSKYADPNFEVATHHLTDRAGNPYVVIDVPGGHRVPVRARAAGPTGHALRDNVYYTRRPGPQSAPIADAADWDAVISRCMRAQRETLADMFREIARTMGGPQALREALAPGPAEMGPQERLTELETFAIHRLTELVAEVDGPMNESRFRYGVYSCGYAIENASEPQALTVLKRILHEVEGHESGWPMWMVPDGRMPERVTVVDGMLECFLNDDQVFDDGAHSDYWLAHPAGRLMLLRGYQDDSKIEGELPPGELLDITIPIFRAGELALHAHRLGAHLADAGAQVHLRMTWRGLHGRKLSTWASGRRMIGPFYTSMQDEATGLVAVAYDAIPNTLPEIAQALVGPLYAAFDFEPDPIIYSQEIAGVLRRG